jgi:hypothetical protein
MPNTWISKIAIFAGYDFVIGKDEAVWSATRGGVETGGVAGGIAAAFDSALAERCKVSKGIFSAAATNGCTVFPCGGVRESDGMTPAAVDI